jgi:tetratricopeptide (TPR) repeat protein
MIVMSIFLFTALVLLGTYLLGSLWNKEATQRSNMPLWPKASKVKQGDMERNPFKHTLLLNRLHTLESQGAYEQVARLYEKESLSQPLAGDELATHISILQIVGRCYGQLSDCQNAKYCYGKAIDYSRKIGHPTHELEVSLKWYIQKAGSGMG